MTRFLNTDLDVTLGGLTPSDEKVSSQKATKTYIDAQLDNYTTTSALNTLLGNKQDVISDLTTIRDNASAGKSASDTIAGYGNIVTHNTNEFQPVGDYALKSEIPTVPTNVSAFTNDSGYITKSVNNLDNYTTTTSLNGLLANKQNKLVAGQNIVIDENTNTISVASQIILDYNDLENKPSINSVELSGNKTLTDLGIQPSGNYAIDTDVVHKTGDETIGGNKTFNSDGIVIKSTSIDWAETTTSDRYSGITIQDKNGKRIGKLEQYQIKDTGEIRLGLNVCGYDANDDIKYSPTLGVAINKDGTSSRAYADTPAAASNDTTIATTAWCRTTGNGLVHTEGDETINGIKTFTQDINGTAIRARWADLAEYYEADTEYTPGTLLQVGGSKEVTLATTECNLVVSTKPGVILNKSKKDGIWVLCALAGRVPLKVDCKVHKADKLYLSYDNEGYASNITNGRCIGIALEDGDKLVNSVVKLSF